MKKTIKNICSVIKMTVLVVIVFVFGYLIEIDANAYTNKACGFYRSDFTSGVAVSGPNQFASFKSYAQQIFSNASVNTWKSNTESCTVEFIHTHGSPGYFTLNNSGTIVSGNMISNISFNGVPKLVYISACQTGNTGAGYGNVGTSLVAKGVKAVVAFKTNISASTNTDGIHRFNSLVGYKLTHGSTISSSLYQSKLQIYNESGDYWGTDSYVIYGNSGLSF